MDENPPKIIVAIPCYNEEKTIAKVVQNFKRELPHAEILVYDNNSTDNSRKLALEAGAIVRSVFPQGKGNVVQQIFRDFDEDVCILVDGDDTYPAEAVHQLLDPVLKGKADMVVGTRLEGATRKTITSSHRFGNRFFLILVNLFFRTNYRDILSGYRSMNRRFIENIPVFSGGFEVETELTLQALEKGLRIQESPIRYRERPEGSSSKISAFSDGYKIMFTIISILRDYRPMTFFPILSMIFIVLGIFFGGFTVYEYLQTGLITRIPTVLLSILLIIIGMICFIGGFIVGAINRRHNELITLLNAKIDRLAKK